MSAKKRIYVAGHKGMVGSALVRLLSNQADIELIVRERSELDLLNQQAVQDFFEQENIDQVYLAAAKVGGIVANNRYPADFIYENLMIESNVIHSAHMNGLNKLLFLGSSCIYPRLADQPVAEEALLTGGLEPTNEPYAAAKILGIKLCESYNRQHGRDYRSVMPASLYGENDNFHSENSHVIPALMRRFHDAKLAGDRKVEVWGTGNAMREFLHVNDMAMASVYIMNLDEESYLAHSQPMLSHINVGTGIDCTIRELVEIMASVVGYQGKIEFDISKPDGTPRKLLNIARIKKMGWECSVSLEDGLKDTYRWFLNNLDSFRK
jgi:GDP-L-fucose synthase